MNKYLPLIVLVLLAGCSVGPDYKTPENTVTDSWQPVSGDFSQDTVQTDWWKLFNDPLLDKYMVMAAENNKDLMAAEETILQARALRMVAASSFYPQLEANLNGTKTYFSKNGPIFAGSSLTEGPSATTGLPFVLQIPQVQPLYNALFDATWEIDIFGKTRRSVEAAEATIGSAIESRNDLLVSVLAEIARNYMELRSGQEKIRLLKHKIEITETETKLSENKYERGYANKLDVETNEAALFSAKAELPDVEAQVYRSIYALSILTGQFPEALVEELMPERPLPSPPKNIAIGLRSDLLRRRPDVRKSERDLATATANVGVAVASFYPSIVLSADAGFQALKLNKLFKAKSKTWDYGGNIGIPLFQGGSLVGNLRANKAVAGTATYAYQQTVLNALQETESALISYTEDLAKTHQLAKTNDHTQNIVTLTKSRYRKGLVPLTQLLDSEKQQIASDLSLLDSRTQTLIDLITLYKALGGGWQPPDE